LAQQIQIPVLDAKIGWQYDRIWAGLQQDAGWQFMFNLANLLF
jgi:hypothetical protein